MRARETERVCVCERKRERECVRERKKDNNIEKKKIFRPSYILNF